jgi:hypothetical protein
MRRSSAVDPMATTNQKDLATATLAGALGIDEASLAKALAAIAVIASSQPVGARYLDEEDAARYLKTSRRRPKDLRTGAADHLSFVWGLLFDTAQIGATDGQQRMPSRVQLRRQRAARAA